MHHASSKKYCCEEENLQLKSQLLQVVQLYASTTCGLELEELLICDGEKSLQPRNCENEDLCAFVLFMTT